MAFTGFVDEFSNSPIQPTYSSYLGINLTTTPSVVLEWVFVNQNTSFPFSQTVQVTTNTVTSNSITFPDATQTSVGQSTLILNTSTTAFNILYPDGTTLTSIGAGVGFYLTLTDNTTTNGTWLSYQLAATPSAFVAANLIDNSVDSNGHGNQGGLKAFSSFLKQNITVNTFTSGSTYTQASGDRGSLLVWESGTGIHTCLAVDTYPDGGFDFMIANNSAGGQVTVVPQAGDTINGSTSPFVLYPGDSSIFTTDGVNTIYSYASTRATTNVVSLVDIPLNSTPLSLSTTQAGYSIQKFETGSVSGAVSVIYPGTSVGQWIAFNASSNVITLSVASGIKTYILPPQESLNIFSDGTDLYTDPSFLSGDVLLPDGTVSNPSLAFINDQETGLYYTTDALNVGVGGSNVVSFAFGQTQFAVPIVAPLGSNGNPSYSFSGNTTTGFYYSSPFLTVTSGGVSVFDFSSGINSSLVSLSVANGTVTNPGLAFRGDVTTGLYYGSSNLNITAAGIQVIAFNQQEISSSVPIDAPIYTQETISIYTIMRAYA